MNTIDRGEQNLEAPQPVVGSARLPPAPLPPAPLPPGHLLRGRFELLEPMGRGGTATVYRAIDRIRRSAGWRDAEVAIKLIEAQGEIGAWAIATLHREARYLLGLHHPNVIRAFDSDRDGTHHFVVLERLHGKTLSALLKQRPGRVMPWPQARVVLAGAAAGLAHVHAAGLVHGDVKPGNLFVCTDGTVKLFDFGAARSIGQEAAASEIESETGSGGEAFDAMTPTYASPESFAGAPPDPRDDVFALAVVAVLTTTGRHPFGGRTAAEALRLGLAPDRPPDLSRRRWFALSEALCLDRTHRTACVTDFAHAFADASPWEEFRRRWSRLPRRDGSLPRAIGTPTAEAKADRHRQTCDAASTDRA